MAEIKNATEFFDIVEKRCIEEMVGVLSGTVEMTSECKIRLLELAVKVGICGLYESHKKDVLNSFSIKELTDIVSSTEPFKKFTVEHIYRVALGLEKVKE